MFVDFFYLLRSRGIKVSITEWLALMEALALDLSGTSLTRFYHLCRSVCVKNEAHFDLYDISFAEYFHDVEPPEDLTEKVLDWLKDPKFPRELTEEELAQLEVLDLETLREQFEERMREQEERHDGGNRWVGTGGTSPFGHGGQHPSGVRLGGEGRNRSAVQVATKRRFRNLRHDRVLDVRQLGIALRQLRRLTRDGRPDELDIDETIDMTAKNAGEIEMVFRPERKNTVKLLLLMDVGGSMTAYSQLCERLFSAAHAATHFKAFKYYYFHNCPYEALYSDMARREGEPTAKILQDLDKDWFCFIVGDAAMAPYELTAKGGAIDYFHYNDEPGYVWLQRISQRFPRSVWLNPEPKRYWESTMTTVMIREIFDMYSLSLDGIEEAIRELRQKRQETR
ncbi:MAG: VWA containing CoxE family protein [Deltaproteobacteria bacterium]|nr:VWA containing CoxE family protein [Deltaproteobacteria bacterium]MBU54091.1 VWA containing CoxE family protein [Deltaproteobacteria bacterium]|tara:strand:+ start:1418 stop:2605 length:1188 start_codon:yes stop_codon:yes gene_type:complete